MASETGLEWSPARANRLGAEQVAALFGSVTLGVLGAAVGAWVLSFALVRLAALPWLLGLGWALYISLCALAHIALFLAYRRTKPRDDRWRPWAAWFTAIALLEGLGWGWMPVTVAAGGSFEVEMLAIAVGLAVSTASIPAFSTYLPAFAAFFLPATLPYAVWSVAVPSPMHQATSLLMAVFVAAIFALGVVASRSFRQLVSLRIQTTEMADDLRRQKEIAEAASLSKSSFLAAASHDLRQPVHALGLFVGALRGIEMAPEGRRLVQQIEASTNAMDGLFTALLDISRLDAGIVEVHRRRFAVDPFLDRICRDHTAEAEAKGLAIALHRSGAVVFSDPVLLERIVRNLVSNAVRYTDAGRIVVGCRRRGDTIALQVWDTGRGIPLDQREKVFQEYFQLGNPERDRAKGLGLGLAIVRRLSDLLGSPMTLRSESGRGSCFEIVVPRADGAGLETDPVDDGNAGALVKGLVVVVDDELAIREGMATLLGGWGHEVIAVGSGDEVLQRLATHPVRPALIICDYRLRGSERGIEVIERLRAEYNDAIPAMLITGDTAPDRLAEAQASGLLLLHKPVSNSRLRAAIVNLTTRPESPAAEVSEAIEPVG